MLSRHAILSLLEELGVDYRLHEHAAVMTVAESRIVRTTLDGLLCKCLLLAGAGGTLWLLTVEADLRVDLKKPAARLGIGRLSFAPPDALETCLGCKPGAVSILGLANDTGSRVEAVIQDTLLATEERLHFHPLVNTATVGIFPGDLSRFLAHIRHDPVVVADIAQ